MQRLKQVNPRDVIVVDSGSDFATRRKHFDQAKALYQNILNIEFDAIGEHQLITLANDPDVGLLPLLPTTIRAIRFSPNLVIGRNELNVNGNPEYDDSNVISIEDILAHEADIVNKTFRWPIVTPTTVSD